MSFANEIKQEVSIAEIESADIAQLSALIKILGVYKLNNRGIWISVENENIVIIRRVVKLLKYFFDLNLEIASIRNMKFGKKNIYSIRILNDVNTVLESLNLKNEKGFIIVPNREFFKNDLYIRKYLSGLFLASGSINSPENSNYHLEVRCPDEEYAKNIIKLMGKIYIDAKKIKRRENQVVYVKASEQIGDFLRAISASNSLMKFEDMRIRRDFKNSITRLDNCTTANDVKTYKNALKQIKEIEKLKELGIFETMDIKLKQVANLRLLYPEESLNDLVDLFEEEYETTISKSGIAHRFRKISELVKNEKKEF